MTPGDPLPHTGHDDLVLVRSADRLLLFDRSQPKDSGIGVDFLAGRTHARLRGIRRRTHPLARAVGRHRPLPVILDATAGLGRDAFVLACLGYRVLAWERCPTVHALLADGVARLLADPQGRELVGDRLTVALGDARSFLTDSGMAGSGMADPKMADSVADSVADVVYLDPMFPERKKSALVKKEMQMLELLLGPTDEFETESRALLAQARQAANQRVVVKRPAAAPPLAEDVSYIVRGRSVRWDVYLA